MPAASWSELLNFETQFDTALAAILAPFAAAPYRFTLYPQVAVATLVSPRLEYQFTLGAPAGPGDSAQKRAAGDRSARALAYNFSLLFRFVNDRTALVATQRTYAGALRDLLSPPAPAGEGAFSSSVLPYLAIDALQEERAIRGVVAGAEGAKGYDAFESTWVGIFSIRQSALPD